MLTYILRKPVSSFAFFIFATIFLQLQLAAYNSLSLDIAGQNNIKVEFSNTDRIIGLQFTLHTPQGVAIQNIQKGDRVTEAQWELSYHKKNDSTIIVVLLNMTESELQKGNGSIAELGVDGISLTEINNPPLSLTGVVLSGIGGKAVDVAVTNNMSTEKHTLHENYPNPFNPSTTISYELFSPTHVQLIVYDILGREIQRLVDEEQNPGIHAAVWDCNDNNGLSVASGTYIYRLVTNQTTTCKKMLLEK